MCAPKFSGEKSFECRAKKITWQPKPPDRKNWSVKKKKTREPLSLSFSRTTVGIRLRLAARTPLCHVTIDNNPPMSECVARLCRKRLCRKVSRLLATVATLVFFECFLFFIETGLLIFFLCFYLTRVGHLV